MENKLDTVFKIKQINEDENYGYIEGYASVFDIPDTYKDIVKKGAFLKNIENKKNSDDPTIPMLWSHEKNNPIGYFSVNEMFEDDLGLYVKGKILLSIPQGRTVYSLLKAGVCNKMSIGYIIRKDYYNTMNRTRELIDIDLYEISLVMFPANKSAKILNVKSMINIKDFDISNPEKVIDCKQAEENINKILENKEYKEEDFYLLNNSEQREGLFVDIVDGKPEINIKSIVDFSKKENIKNLNINETQKKQLETKINSLFSLIREKTNDLTYISPFEVQQGIISNFTIKDCERFLKKAGLTNSGFKTFFERIGELKGCGNKKPKKTNQSKNEEVVEESKKEIDHSLDENAQTPEELSKISEELKNLQNLLKI